MNPSFSAEVDTLNGPGLCNTSNGFQQGKAVPAAPLNGNFGQPAWGRCGYGTRMPLLLVSPLAKRNYVDHTVTDQSSVLRFIEDNWLSGERIQPGGSFDTIAGPLDNVFNFDDRDDEGPRKLVLDEATGVVVSASKGDNGDRHYGATVLRRGGLQIAATPPTVCSKSRVLPEAAPRLSGITC